MRIDDARKIARSLVAFANTDGGRLLIGVKDNGSVCGVSAGEEIHMLEAAASMHCRPEVTFAVQLWKVENRTVMEVNVAPSPNKPHRAEAEPGVWKVFIRRNDQNLSAPSVLLEVWKNRDSLRPAHYTHTEREMKIFGLLRESADGVSLSQLIRLTRLRRPAAVSLLARLIRWNLVDMYFSQDQARYRLKKD